MTITWSELLRARSSDAHLRNFARSGGRSLSGREQRAFSDAGFWTIVKSGLVINTRERAAAYRAMIARLRQGEDILVPLCDLYTPLGSRLATASSVLAADAALRATGVSLIVSGLDLAAGHYFSIGDRLHLVTEIVSGPSEPPLINQLVSDSAWSDALPWADAVAGGSAYTVRILPPLRAAAPAGTAASFSDLKLRCELQDLAAGDLDLDLGRFGTPSLTFIESP